MEQSGCFDWRRLIRHCLTSGKLSMAHTRQMPYGSAQRGAGTCCPLPSWHSSSRPPNVRGRAQRGSSLATGFFTGESSRKPTSPISSWRAGSAAFALASRPRRRGWRRLFLSPPFRSGCRAVRNEPKRTTSKSKIFSGVGVGSP
jgi:hypothetical protein